MQDDEEYLIAYSNLKFGLFKNQKSFISEENLNNFYKNEYLGFPICLPKNIKYFNYRHSNYFIIDKKKFAKKIFNTSNLDYTGVKKFFRYGNIFAENVTLKKKYNKKFRYYFNSMNSLKNKILRIKKKHKKICAMQIRNVPHFGHEAVFKHILSKFDFLYLNPIFGIKKKNDVSNFYISKALNFIKKKYKNVGFDPIWTNFHYAGPREALHHMSIRENLGFDYFYVGRDHAGAENLYNQTTAVKKVSKFKSNFSIKPFTSDGGFYCKSCGKYLIKGSCNHKKLLNISGTNFRNHLNKKKFYKHADLDIQKILIKI
jgi:sulfate adenylyltransferase